MRFLINFAEVSVIASIRAAMIAPPLRRHTVNRTSLRGQRMRTLTPQQDESHQHQRQHHNRSPELQVGPWQSTP